MTKHHLPAIRRASSVGRPESLFACGGLAPAHRGRRATSDAVPEPMHRTGGTDAAEPNLAITGRRSVASPSVQRPHLTEEVNLPSLSPLQVSRRAAIDLDPSRPSSASGSRPGSRPGSRSGSRPGSRSGNSGWDSPVSQRPAASSRDASAPALQRPLPAEPNGVAAPAGAGAPATR